MRYEYVIQNADGAYYRGSAHGDGRDWTTDIREGFDGAFGYTQDGAYEKLRLFPTMFQGCKVVRR